MAAPVVSTPGVRVVRAADWDAAVTEAGGLDTYTRAAYYRASALLEVPGTVPVLLRFRHRDAVLVLPLLLRPLPDGSGWDAVSAYGYGGPLARDGAAVAAFGPALDEWARVNGVVCTFLRLHPPLGNTALVPPTAEVVTAGCTVAWDLTPGRDLFAGMHAHHRRAARKADRAGLEVTVTPRPFSLSAFRDLYVTTMERQHADPFFYFPAAYWKALVAEQQTLHPVLVEGRVDGELIAALLCFVEGPRLHYHLGASADAARSIGASNRCFLAAAEWGREQGVEVFHLGGGLGGSMTSSLFTFKHRFDPASEPLPFSVAKLVHDRDRYRELAGTDETAGYFPPWRRSA
ncbi:GNAT family N-acetyltransferase [Blastococcus sp. TML/M2B]|uniref:GNAT family N-acetyltransferase n=1 Tax=unclassified Blastococcus TaxID=2619396 RepID=UPI00190DC4F2|nr:MULTISPECIES: GNAT family N-acetyltransferase [unclassified Blastococcus]MBN1091282.1 GNAT family N-acetyltransferase [Blastococcus sp. TML/M2B]MBN1095160.1 GNAT family N-acetyltransferase [Blastococcus sp. TML/C7B]